MRRIAIVSAVAFLVGCAVTPTPQQAFTITEVRVIVNVVAEPADTGAGGALAGGLLFGPVGAVVGYAMSKGDPPPPRGEVVACRVVATSGNRTYDFTHGWPKEQCALLRPGDTFVGWQTPGGYWRWGPLVAGAPRP